MEQKKFAEVIPLVKLPRAIGRFDYEIPDKLLNQVRPGTLVWVNFRGRKTAGVVSAIKENPAETKTKIQPLTAVLPEPSWLNRESINDLAEIADSAAVSPALFLRAAMPPFPMKTFELERTQTHELKNESSFRISARQKDAFTEIFQKIKKSQDLFIRTPSFAHALPILLKLVQSGEETRIIAPSAGSAAKLAREVSRYGAFAVFLDRKAGKNAQFRAWLGSRDANAVISAPLYGIAAVSRQKRGTAVLFDEASPLWKHEDGNPRFDAKKAIVKLAQSRGLRILRLGALPSLEFWKHRGAEGIILFPAPGVQSLVVNMKDFWRSGGSGPVSDAVWNEILSKNPQKIFILNYRTGRAGLLVCNDCEYAALCENCREPLAVKSKSFWCAACKNKTELPVSCPACKGPNLKEIGAGAEKVKQIIGDRAETGTFKDLSKFLNSGAYFDLTIFADPDSLISRPSITGREECAWILGTLASMTKPDGLLIIQTKNPELRLWRVAEGDFSPFLDEESNLRKEFGLPPFRRIAKITAANPDPKSAEADIKNAASKLSMPFSGPFPSRPPYLRGMHCRHILIKYKEQDAAALMKQVRGLSDNLIIDLDSHDLL